MVSCVLEDPRLDSPPKCEAFMGLCSASRGIIPVL